MTVVTGPTRVAIKEEARHYIDELVTNDQGRVQDSVSGQFGLDAAVSEAYVEYSKQVKCFPKAFTLAATASKDTYLFTDFDASGRLFDIYAAAYNHWPLEIVGMDTLDRRCPTWRFDPTGTPQVLFPFGEGQFRVYPSPGDTLDIDIEGYQSADLTTFVKNSDAAAVHESRGKVLAAYAASLFCIRFAGVQEIELQKSAVWSIWTEGVAKAKKEVHGSDRIITVMGRYAESGGDSGWPGYNRGPNFIGGA